MIHSQQESCSRQGHLVRQARNPLLQRHPVLLPILLVSSAIVLVILSFFTDSVFPILFLIGTPSALVCLLLAFILGTCGVLASIIGMIESAERYRIQFALFPRSKERGYDRT